MERRKELEKMGLTAEEAEAIEEREYRERQRANEESEAENERAVEAWMEKGLSREDAEDKVNDGIFPEDDPAAS